MQSENLYIGDDKFQKFLDHYQCPTPLQVVKLKFAGAICSPNNNLRPTDVISSLFPEDSQPRLTTKAEAELFFKFFMGLWDEMFTIIQTNTLTLPKITVADKKDLTALCYARAAQIEQGFVEGFWGGCSSLNIPQFAAELINSLSDMAGVYGMLAKQLEKKKDTNNILEVILNTDKTVEKTFKFLIENLILPHIAKLQRTLN
ncbi:MAG: hypothetical protein NC218_04645 [Acetobacter sp.]|nr:hypothetical protein [Acetobacter sp.]